MDSPELVDPLSGAALKSTLLRVSAIVLAVWFVGLLVFSASQTRWVEWTALIVPALVTASVAGVLIWTLRRARIAREMAGILRGVETQEDRRAALEKLEQGPNSKDPASIFARAQLEMQEDPKRALATLETIDLAKVMAPVADEARSQRAMIHLMLGQVSAARSLVDGVDLKRHNDSRTRAMLAAVCAETWARSGDAQRASDTLGVFDVEDPTLAPVRPQILRAQAFVLAQQTKTKELRRALRAMAKIDIRLLGGFLQGKTHPLLQKEAKKMLEQSGAVPRKLMVQRPR